MNEEMIDNPTHSIDRTVLGSIHATPEDSWLDFILED